MRKSKLSDHTFIKGKFISPWNNMNIPLNEVSWFLNRLPEYLWIGLIFDHFGREKGLVLCGKIIHYISKYNLETLCFSELLSQDKKTQSDIWDFIAANAGSEILSPLTSIVTYSEYPDFSSCFCNTKYDTERRFAKIGEILKNASFHQSHLSTDIRFIALYYLIAKGKLKFTNETKFMVDQLVKYPKLSHEDDEMKIIRPTIRSAEMGIIPEDIKHKNYINKFWKVASTMTDCELFYIKFEKEADDVDVYIDAVKGIMAYYKDMLVTAYPLDNKMTVLCGIATYSYKRLLELINCNLYNEISGRSIVRVMIENCIMMKYLIKHESEHEDIWKEYQYYGIGQYKLIAKRHEATEGKQNASHVDYEYLMNIVNEFKDEEYIDMDTKYFDKQNVREKANDVGEKDLFGLYYDYDSAFEHGLWGAVRESSLLKCNAASHQFHCVPDTEDIQKMKSVWTDVKMVFDKTLAILESVYGLPEHFSINKE